MDLSAKVIFLVLICCKITVSLCEISDALCVYNDKELQNKSSEDGCKRLILDRLKLIDIPHYIFNQNPELIGIHFKNCDITNLSFSELRNVSSIVKLDFTECNISVIQGNAFDNFKSLEALSFTNTRVSEIDGTPFKRLQDLKYLTINRVNASKNIFSFFELPSKVGSFHCKYCSIDDEHLVKIDKMLNVPYEVDLSNNSIKFFKCRIRPVSLIITFNEMQEIFDTCDSKEIIVHHNNISTLIIRTRAISIEASYNSIIELKCDRFLKVSLLSLSCNNLSNFKCIGAMFRLKLLNLSFNKFQYFYPEWFENLSRLKNIEVIGNPIKSFKPEMFASKSNQALMQIYIDKFDYGYENMKKLYPALAEINLQYDENDSKMITKILENQSIAVHFYKIDNLTKERNYVNENL